MRHTAAASYMDYVKRKAGDVSYFSHKQTKSLLPNTSFKPAYTKHKAPPTAAPMISKQLSSIMHQLNVKPPGQNCTHPLSHTSLLDNHRKSASTVPRATPTPNIVSNYPHPTITAKYTLSYPKVGFHGLA